MRKKTKHALAIILAGGALMSMLIPAAAAQPPEINPRYVGISNISAGLAISTSGKATCVSSVMPDNRYTVTLTMELQQDGRTIKSWNTPVGTSQTVLEKSYNVTSGHDYQVVATATVKSGSSVINSYKAYSSIVSY